MSLRYAILITAAPAEPASALAVRFIQELLQQGHQLHSAFFFGDGVLHANSLITPPQDETPPWQQWHALAQRSGAPFNVCISSALRRGVVDGDEAQRYELSASNLAAGFTICGLGQWVEACLESDRILRFGGH